MKKYYRTILASSLLVFVPMLPVYASSNMVAMSDNELSLQTGQALLNLGYTAPDTSKVETNFGFYKFGLEGKVELNANIKNLELGCGGRNGAGACDISMSNVSLSGMPDGKITSTTDASANGTPTWSTLRANTSAVITNPFLEFAIKNPNSASTRQIAGFRLSAEEILGYLSAGTANVANPTDGIKMFSGFIKVGQTPVKSFTEPTIYGTSADQTIYANVNVAGLSNVTAFSNVNGMTPGAAGYKDPTKDADLNKGLYQYKDSSSSTAKPIWGIMVDRQDVEFVFPETIVTGNRMQQLNLVVNDVPIPTIAIGALNGGIAMTLDLAVLGTDSATFFMGKKDYNCAGTKGDSNCSYITNLKANVAVNQNFNLIHNLPVTSGGYLSLQSTAIKWPGSDAADTSQPGWWMSFKDPLDFGALNPTSGINMTDVLPQISTYITNFLSQNTINLGIGDALGALFGAPLYKSIGNIQMGANDRAVMTLQNLLLDGNQKPVPNCFGNLKFC